VEDETLDFNHFYKKAEFELDYYHSTDDAKECIFAKFGLIEIVEEFMKMKNYQKSYLSLIGLLSAWVEVAPSMENPNNLFLKTYDKLLMKILNIFDKIESEEQLKLINFIEKDWKIVSNSNDHVLKFKKK
jgi:hypothetical protein